MSLRPVLLAVAALAAASGICLTLCLWGAGRNHDLEAVAREIRRDGDLERPLEVRRRRHEAKRALAAKMVARRMTLREAADRFRRLDEADTGSRPDLPRLPRDEQSFREDVLDYVWIVLGHQGRFATAARWYAEAFTAHPYLLAGPPTGHRYHAARAAVLAGCGQGRDAAGLDETSRAGFRHQALGWLRAELGARHRLLEQQPEKTRWIVAYDMHRWLEDPDFAGVRGSEALARLPEPERQAWQMLWADVADTLARTQGKAPPEAEADREVPPPGR